MTAGKAREKPVEIEYMRWVGGAAAATPIIDWIITSGGTARYHGDGVPNDPDEQIAIDTLEGTMRADVGDIIIRGVAGEFYPCKPDIFTQTYDIIEEN